MPTIEEQNTEAFNGAEEYFTFEGLTHTERRIFDGISPRDYPNVLDVGAGCGRTSIELQKRGFEVTAFDIAEKLVEYGNKKHPSLHMKVGDVLALDKTYAPRSFDLVLFSYNGLDYLFPETNRYAALCQIHRVLRPGGLFIYQSHNSWWNGEKRVFWLPFHDKNGAIKPRYAEETSGPRKMRLVFFHQNPLSQSAILRAIGFSSVKVRGWLPILHPLNYWLDYAPIYIATK